jgi:hypothetical protein
LVGVLGDGSVDDVGEASFEDAEGFGLGLAPLEGVWRCGS